ncbi:MULTISPECIES: TetR/AcrR family transcriptional regulator [Microbacterium]|uniref:TetR/AcrR family transcriptional regulator n=1 Tax=Microbacterium TaxID=33882 RepID=UPI00300FDB56
MAYHHGDLAAALVEAAVELTREGGPDALTVREATRRVGVSPNAAYRHFPHRDALLEATADAIQARLAAAMAAQEGATPVARLRRVGRAYVDFALAEPGWFAVAFFGGRPPGPAQLAQSPAYGALIDALDALVAEGAVAPASRDDAAWACWATVHGFAELALHGPLVDTAPPELRRRAAVAIDAIIAGVQSRPGERGVG